MAVGDIRLLDALESPLGEALSIRVLNAMGWERPQMRLGVTTLGQLCLFSREEVARRVPNMGKVSTRELDDWLHDNFGLSLKPASGPRRRGVRLEVKRLVDKYGADAVAVALDGVMRGE